MDHLFPQFNEWDNSDSQEFTSSADSDEEEPFHEFYDDGMLHHAMGWGFDSDEMESDFSGTDGEDWSEEEGDALPLAYNHEVSAEP
jgi:hypothetical protein